MENSASLENISVVLCFYKGNSLFEVQRSLDSIYHQTLTPKEIILVKDGPIGFDLGSLVLSQKIDVKIVNLKENIGVARARQIGVSTAIMPFIAFMDADDHSVRHRFELQVQAFHIYPHAHIVGGSIRELYEDGARIVRELPEQGNDLIRYSRFRCPVNNVTAMIKREVFDCVNIPNFRNYEDYLFWVLCIINGFQIVNIPTVLVEVNASPEYFSRRKNKNMIFDDVKFFKYIFSLKYINIFQFSYAVLVRMFVFFCVPSKILSTAYRLFLRSPEGKRHM